MAGNEPLNFLYIGDLANYYELICELKPISVPRILGLINIPLTQTDTFFNLNDISLTEAIPVKLSVWDNRVSLWQDIMTTHVRYLTVKKCHDTSNSPAKCINCLA